MDNYRGPLSSVFLYSEMVIFPLDKNSPICVKVQLLRFQAFMFPMFFIAPEVFSPILPFGGNYQI